MNAEKRFDLATKVLGESLSEVWLEPVDEGVMELIEKRRDSLIEECALWGYLPDMAKPGFQVSKVGFGIWWGEVVSMGRRDHGAYETAVLLVRPAVANPDDVEGEVGKKLPQICEFEVDMGLLEEEQKVVRESYFYQEAGASGGIVVELVNEPELGLVSGFIYRDLSIAELMMFSFYERSKQAMDTVVLFGGDELGGGGF